jgi:hypothetical protein
MGHDWNQKKSINDVAYLELVKNKDMMDKIKKYKEKVTRK